MITVRYERALPCGVASYISLALLCTCGHVNAHDDGDLDFMLRAALEKIRHADSTHIAPCVAHPGQL